MSISLNEINEKVKEANKPLVYMYFKTREGEVSNIIFQKGRYFTLLKNNKLLLLNPLRDVERWYNKVHQREWILIGSGSLLTEIPVTQKNLVTSNQS